MVASPTPAMIEISLNVFLSPDEFCEAIKIAAAAMDMGVLPEARSKSTALFAENKIKMVDYILHYELKHRKNCNLAG